MGNTDSKLSGLYKDHVFKLARPGPSEQPLFKAEVSADQLTALYLNRTASDEVFSQFYLDFISAGNALTVELLNSLVSHHELRIIQAVNAKNFVNLLRFAALKILFLSESLDKTSNSNLEAQLTQILVCVRILARIVPVYLEKKRSVDILWTRNGNYIFGLSEPNTDPLDLPPLGLLLVKACVKILFVEGFTITSRGSAGSISHLLWENGVNTQDTAYHHQSPRIDSNRLEIVNLLLSLCSSDLYQPADFISKRKRRINKFLFCLTTMTPEYDLVCLVASIINLTCRYCSSYQDETSVPYHDLGYKFNHQQHLPALRLSLVLSSLQLLNLMCFNNWNRSETFDFTTSLKLQSPNDITNSLPNMVLSYLSTFNREFDLKLILTSFAKVFKLPVDLAIEQESNPLNFLSRKSSSSNLMSTTAVTNDNTNGNTINGNGAQINNGDSNNMSHNPVNNNPNNTNNKNKNNANSNVDSSGETSNNNNNNNNSYATTLPPISPMLIQTTIFFTKMIQANKCFENYVADKFANRIIIFSVYYINFYNDFPELSTTLIPLCSNLALLLSSRKLVLSKLLDKFTPNYYTNKIPNFFKLSTGSINNITYRDFTIIHLCNTAISDIRDNIQPRPWLFELIYNLLPIPSNIKDEELIQLSSKKHSGTFRHSGLSYNASMTLLHLVSKMSTKKYLTTYAVPSFAGSNSSAKSYLLSPGFKLDLLALILRAILVYIVLYFDEALNLAFAICRHQKVLLQVRDSISTISKALKGNGIIDGIGKIQTYDYFEYSLNPRLLQSGTELYNRDLTTSSNSGELLTQNFMFHKTAKDDTESNSDCSDGDDNGDEELGVDDDKSNSKYDEAANKDQDVDNGPLELSKIQSNVKNCEILEQADFRCNSVLSEKELFYSLRPKWPLGITSKSKAKSSATSDFSDSWIGADSLKVLIRIARILLHHFPNIATITTAEYYTVVNEISEYKDKFKKTVEESLPVYIREMKDTQSLKLDLSENNVSYQQWLYRVTWSDIFNTHTGPYSASQAFAGLGNATNVDHMNSLSRESTVESATPTMPALERWNSNGSAISRTNSNNSSLLSYFSNQNHEVVPNSPLELTANHHVSSPQLNSARNKNNTTGNGHSFFRFSWTGFSKADEYSPIREEEYYDGTSSSINPNRRTPFTLDSGILKPNIWAGTKVRLFNVRRQEREEFSLLDMTSSLLKKFRFGSTTSVNSLETINTNLGGHNTANSNNLTPVSSRPWTPRDSINSNHSIYSTPKQL